MGRAFRERDQPGARLMFRNKATVFGGGAVIGALGGLIGLGGAEFRLPLLIGLFRFNPLEAVILNKAMSLIVVVSAIVFRTKNVPVDAVVGYWPVALNLLAGSLIGAWMGAGWALRLRSERLSRVIAVLLLLIALALLFGHEMTVFTEGVLAGSSQMVVGVFAGLGIGGVAALLGVAGGELLIPTLILLFGLDVKLAGSLSLAVSLPTMVVAFARYSQDDSFRVLARNRAFLWLMATGSIVGTMVGGLLLGAVPQSVLLPLLAGLLVLSALKLMRHA